MVSPLHHPDENTSNAIRDDLVRVEPRALRTYTPTQAVLARSAGVFHWTPEGRRLYDFTSGVLVANLGHNPQGWMRRFTRHMGWPADPGSERFFSALPMTAYNAITGVEVEASRRLLEVLHRLVPPLDVDHPAWQPARSDVAGEERLQRRIIGPRGRKSCARYGHRGQGGEQRAAVERGHNGVH